MQLSGDFLSLQKTKTEHEPFLLDDLEEGTYKLISNEIRERERERERKVIRHEEQKGKIYISSA